VEKQIRIAKKTKKKKTKVAIQYVDISQNSFYNIDKQTYSLMTSEEKEYVIPNDSIYESVFEENDSEFENNNQ
jgi:hypothetical protein